MTKYRTAPIPSTGMPGGVPYIIGNEAAERFSFYGMKGILVVFMTQHLLDSSGDLDTMGPEDATAWYHVFNSAVYFTPVLGALVSDIWLGKYRTILGLSIVYCLGHLSLAVDETRLGLAVGLALISIGSGGIKPCVTAHVGDQFGKTNEHLLEKVFGWFYFSINFGSFASTLLTPWLLRNYGPGWAFGVPGVLMFLATVCFWAGRHKFIHIPPGGWRFVKESFSGEGLRAAGKLCIVYAIVAAFWAVFDQTGSRWVLQAQHMDRTLFGWELLPSQIQAANPLLVMLLIPTFSYVVYPLAARVFRVTPLRKISTGFFVTALAVAVSVWIEVLIEAGETPSIAWQLLAYVILTAGEVLISITCLEFSYTQAPRTMKSFIMALFLLSVTLGNLFTAAVNFFIQNEDGTSKLDGVSYFAFFTGVTLAAGVVFVVVAVFYKEKTYIQEEEGSVSSP